MGSLLRGFVSLCFLYEKICHLGVQVSREGLTSVFNKCSAYLSSCHHHYTLHAAIVCQATGRRCVCQIWSSPWLKLKEIGIKCITFQFIDCVWFFDTSLLLVPSHFCSTAHLLCIELQYLFCIYKNWPTFLKQSGMVSICRSFCCKCLCTREFPSWFCSWKPPALAMYVGRNIDSRFSWNPIP